MFASSCIYNYIDPMSMHAIKWEALKAAGFFDFKVKQVIAADLEALEVA